MLWHNSKTIYPNVGLSTYRPNWRHPINHVTLFNLTPNLYNFCDLCSQLFWHILIFEMVLFSRSTFLLWGLDSPFVSWSTSMSRSGELLWWWRAEQPLPLCRHVERDEHRTTKNKSRAFVFVFYFMIIMVDLLFSSDEATASTGEVNVEFPTRHPVSVVTRHTPKVTKY